MTRDLTSISPLEQRLLVSTGGPVRVNSRAEEVLRWFYHAVEVPSRMRAAAEAWELSAVEDRLDNVWGKKGQAENGGDVGSTLPVCPGEFVDRGEVTAIEKRLPVECPRESMESGELISGRGGALALAPGVR